MPSGNLCERAKAHDLLRFKIHFFFSAQKRSLIFRCLTRPQFLWIVGGSVSTKIRQNTRPFSQAFHRAPHRHGKRENSRPWQCPTVPDACPFIATRGSVPVVNAQPWPCTPRGWPFPSDCRPRCRGKLQIFIFCIYIYI